MKLYRVRYIANRQMFVKFTRRHPGLIRLHNRFWPNSIKEINILLKGPKLKWIASDIYGKPLYAPPGIIVFDPNNWLRRILYFFGAPRRWTRAI